MLSSSAPSLFLAAAAAVVTIAAADDGSAYYSDAEDECGTFLSQIACSREAGCEFDILADVRCRAIEEKDLCGPILSQIACSREAGCEFDILADVRCSPTDCAAKANCEDCAYAGCGWQLGGCQDVPGGSKQGANPCPVQDVGCWTVPDQLEGTWTPAVGFCDEGNAGPVVAFRSGGSDTKSDDDDSEEWMDEHPLFFLPAVGVVFFFLLVGALYCCCIGCPSRPCAEFPDGVTVAGAGESGGGGQTGAATTHHNAAYEAEDTGQYAAQDAPEVFNERDGSDDESDEEPAPAQPPTESIEAKRARWEKEKAAEKKLKAEQKKAAAVANGAPPGSSGELTEADVGKRCHLDNGKVFGNGTIRFVGAHIKLKKTRVGVEMDVAVGNGNGTFNRHEYFKCEADHGMLVVPKHVSLGEKDRQSAVASTSTLGVQDEEC